MALQEGTPSETMQGRIPDIEMPSTDHVSDFISALHRGDRSNIWICPSILAYQRLILQLQLDLVTKVVVHKELLRCGE